MGVGLTSSWLVVAACDWQPMSWRQGANKLQLAGPHSPYFLTWKLVGAAAGGGGGSATKPFCQSNSKHAYLGNKPAHIALLLFLHMEHMPFAPVMVLYAGWQYDRNSYIDEDNHLLEPPMEGKDAGS